jgi:uncharacterized protein (UPF0332 family)
VKRRPFLHSLVHKSKRALESAQIGLAGRDYDVAVNRAYYAMFDMARAAVLRSGVPEDKLPRTHNGMSGLFWRRAVETGLIDQDLGSQLGRAEALRFKADYTGDETDPKDALVAVEKAALFVQTVERAFNLDESTLAQELEKWNADRGGKVSEPNGPDRREAGNLEPLSIEEAQRQARENWLRFRQKSIQRDKDASNDQGGDRDTREDRGHSLGGDLDDPY